MIFYRSLVAIFIFSFCYVNSAKVVEVYDGDTFRISGGGKIRLIGIDAPEQGEPYWKEAKEFLEKEVLGKSVQLEFDIVKFDRYGRILAYVYVDNTFINAELLKKGYAYVSTFIPNIKYVEHFLELQKKAREEKRGLWKITVKREKLYIGSKHSLKFHRPSCPNVKKIKKENKLTLSSREEFLDRGYAPARDCSP